MYTNGEKIHSISATICAKQNFSLELDNSAFRYARFQKFVFILFLFFFFPIVIFLCRKDPLAHLLSLLETKTQGKSQA